MHSTSNSMPHGRTLIRSLVVLVVIALSGLAPVAVGQVSTEKQEQSNAAVEAVEVGATLVADAPDDRVIVPPASEKTLNYYKSGNVLWIVGVLVGLLIPALFLWTGLSARLRTWAIGFGRWWFFALAIYLVGYNAISYLLKLPLAYYGGFVRQHAYDLSNQTLAKWLGDSVKGLAVSTIIATLTIWLVYLLIRKSPTRWWLYAGLAVIPFIFVINMIAPIWIAPMFNDFGPMQDKQLESQILALADRVGIEDSRVFEVDKSVDTERVNAYVSGFLGTKRIVLWDTAIEKLDAGAILFVVGHEMGHYLLSHVVVLVFLMSAIAMLGFYFIYRVSDGLIRRHEKRFGFSKLGDFASLPLLFLLMNMYFFFASPGLNAYTRYMEREADRFGLELTRNNQAAAEGFVKVQTENLYNPYPGPFYKLWRSGHPPLGERVQFCNEYRPWETGEPLRYGDRFRDSE